MGPGLCLESGEFVPAKELMMRATHVQKTAEIEHVAGGVLKNGAEKNMTVYAELPQSVGEFRHGGGLYTEAQMRVFADATHALRTQQPSPSAAVAPTVQRYLPPDGPSAPDAMSEIIAIVDPWPLAPLEKP